MTRIRLRFLSSVLILSTLLFGFSPQISLAATAYQDSVHSLPGTPNDFKRKNVQKLVELEDKRDKNTKH